MGSLPMRAATTVSCVKVVATTVRARRRVEVVAVARVVITGIAKDVAPPGHACLVNRMRRAETRVKHAPLVRSVRTARCSGPRSAVCATPLAHRCRARVAVLVMSVLLALRISRAALAALLASIARLMGVMRVHVFCRSLVKNSVIAGP